MAVCCLFSFLNPDHELKIKEIFAQEFPEARLSLSYEVLPQIREFYRLSTTVINAYIRRSWRVTWAAWKTACARWA